MFKLSEIIATILQSDAFWLAVHLTIVVPLSKLAIKAFNIGGTFLNQISNKQLMSWVVALIVGYGGWLTKTGALNDLPWWAVSIYSLLAGFAANGLHDATKPRV